MNIDFSRPLKTLTGAAIKMAGASDRDLTLGAACAEVLVADLPGEAAGSVSGAEKVRRWKLAKRLVEGGEIDVKSEDVVLLKAVLPKGWPPLIAGQAIDMIEPDEAAAG